MEPTYAYELAERALENYRVIKKYEKKEKTHAVTALISASLCCVVLPEDDIDNCIKSKGFPDRSRSLVEWPNEIREFITSDNDFCIFITGLRNAIAHNDFHFLLSEEKEVLGVCFNIELNNQKRPLKFFEEDLYSTLKNIVELYKEYRVEVKTEKI